MLLRLPGSVRAVFTERLRRNLPLAADRVLHLVRETRGGKLYDSRYGVRGKGEGKYAEAIKALFQTSAARLGLTAEHSRELAAPMEPPLTAPAPSPAPATPVRRSNQLRLFFPDPEPEARLPDPEPEAQLPRGASAVGSSSAQSPHRGNIPAR